MSRTSADYSMIWTRGATAEEEFVYTDADGNPIDLTDYEARMQVRTLDGQYGTSTSDSLMLELNTTGTDPMLGWDTAVEGRLTLKARPDQHAVLNPDNEKKAKYAYSIEVYKPDGSGEYVIPLVTGTIIVVGEVTR